MYEQFYQLKEKPFSLTPDPKFLYLSRQHQGALDHMLYGIQQREGFMVIMGDVGTGKTTLCRCLLDRMEKNVEVALILNPMLSDMDLLRTCIQDLGVKSLRGEVREPAMAGGAVGENQPFQEHSANWFDQASMKELIDSLNAFLLAQHAAGKTTVLIVDEAQNLSLDVMEQLRILSNLETEKEKLLQIIFVGQLELNDKLKLPKLKQLNQRISIRYEITPLSREETKNYISHRLLVAGSGARVVFTRSALSEIYAYAGGYPRLINLVCDRALLAGCNKQVDVIDKPLVRQAICSLLGDEEKNYFVKRFLKDRLPLVASILFFALGLLFFYLSLSGSPAPLAKTPKTEVAAVSKLIKKVARASKAEVVAASNTISKLFTQVAGTPKAEVAVEEKSVSVASGKVESAPKDPIIEDTEATTRDAVAPVEAVPVAEPVTVHEKQEYRVQIYSSKSQSQAEEEARRLEKEGFHVFWKKAVTGGQDWYIVYVGPFDDLDSANIHVDALKFSGRDPILLSVSKTS